MLWDEYWLNICNAVSYNSKCLSRKIGSVIVKDGKHIVSVGYNGPPSGCVHCDNDEYRKFLFNLMYEDKVFSSFPKDIDKSKCPRQVANFLPGTSSGIKYCQAAHSERNAIVNAAKYGHSTEGCSIYMNCEIPCFECAKSIIGSGIIEVVVVKLEDYEKSGITGRHLLKSSGVKLREYSIKD